MEQNMGEVSNMLGNLRNMAVDMGNEIGSQNTQLDRINQKVIIFPEYKAFWGKNSFVMTMWMQARLCREVFIYDFHSHSGF